MTPPPADIVGSNSLRDYAGSIKHAMADLRSRRDRFAGVRGNLYLSALKLAFD